VAAGAPVVLEVRDLRAYLYTRWGVVRAVDGVSFALREGETLGLVGESGCGKTMTGLSLVRLLPEPAGRIVDGQILLEGEDLVTKSEPEMRHVRGRRVSMILQDPQTSLNPVFTIGDQILEALRQRRADGERSLVAQAEDALRRVKVAALDVTIQLQYLALLKEIQARTRLAMLFITHDFGIVARMCDRVAVMYAGRIVETGPTRALFRAPRHPYTEALMASVPRMEGTVTRLPSIEGQPPPLHELPAGCRFADRCAYVDERCRREYPPTMTVGPAHEAACWRIERSPSSR